MLFKNKQAGIAFPTSSVCYNRWASIKAKTGHVPWKRCAVCKMDLFIILSILSYIGFFWMPYFSQALNQIRYLQTPPLRSITIAKAHPNAMVFTNIIAVITALVFQLKWSVTMALHQRDETLFDSYEEWTCSHLFFIIIRIFYVLRGIRIIQKKEGILYKK